MSLFNLIFEFVNIKKHSADFLKPEIKLMKVI